MQDQLSSHSADLYDEEGKSKVSKVSKVSVDIHAHHNEHFKAMVTENNF